MNRREILLAVYVPTVFLAFTQGVMILSLPLLANERSDAYSFASFIVSAAAFGTLLADIPTGTLMIRLGLRTTMLFGAGLVATSTLILAVPMESELVLTLRIIAGIGTAFWGLSRHTFIAQSVPVAMRGRAIAGFGGINRVGVFAGPLVAGSLVTGLGLYAAFLLAGGLAALAFVAAWGWIPRDTVARNTRPHGAPDTGELLGTWHALEGVRMDVMFASLAQIFAQLVRRGRHFIIPLYGVEVIGLDAFEVGVVMTTSAVIDMLMFGPTGFIMDRFGRKFATVPSFALMAVGIFLIPLTSGFGGLLAAGVIIGLGNGFGSGTMMTMGADFAPTSHTGTFLSVWRFIGDSGMVAGPLLVGVVAEAFTLRQSAWVLAGCAAICALMLLFLVRETRVDRSRDLKRPTHSGSDVRVQKQGG